MKPVYSATWRKLQCEAFVLDEVIRDLEGATKIIPSIIAQKKKEFAAKVAERKAQFALDNPGVEL